MNPKHLTLGIIAALAIMVAGITVVAISQNTYASGSPLTNDPRAEIRVPFQHSAVGNR